MRVLASTDDVVRACAVVAVGIAHLVVADGEVAETVHGVGATHAIDDLHVDIADAYGLDCPPLAVVQEDDSHVREDLLLFLRYW